MSAQINLLPSKGFANSALGSVLEFFSTYGRYIIVGTQLIVLLAFFSRFRLDRELSDIRDAIDQKEAIIKDLSGLELEVRLLQQRLANIRNLKENHDFVRDTIFVVKNILPPGTTLQDLSIKPSSIDVDGKSESQQAFSDLVAMLKNSQELNNISFGNISKAGGSEEIEFTFSAEMKKYAVKPSSSETPEVKLEGQSL